MSDMAWKHAGLRIRRLGVRLLSGAPNRKGSCSSEQGPFSVRGRAQGLSPAERLRAEAGTDA
jgi:hypothetical protein